MSKQTFSVGLATPHPESWRDVCESKGLRGIIKNRTTSKPSQEVGEKPW